MGKLDRKTRKSNQWKNLQDACCKYDKALFVNADNVTSKQICVLRKQIRDLGGKMIMGKNVSYLLLKFNNVLDPHENCHP